MQVKKRFLKFVAFKLNLPLELHNYGSIRSQMDFPTLIIQHEAINTISFLYNFINGHITSPYLLDHIQFNSPLYHHRYRSLFYVPSNNTNIKKNSTLSMQYIDKLFYKSRSMLCIPNLRISGGRRLYYEDSFHRSIVALHDNVL